MSPHNMHEYIWLIHPLCITILTIIAQVVAVFFTRHVTKIIWVIVTLGLLSFVIELFYPFASNIYSFLVSGRYSNTDLYLPDKEIIIGQFIIFVLSVFSIIIYTGICDIEQRKVKMEFISLILLSTVGVLISMISGNILVLFCALELQSLSGYALAAFNNKDVKSSEAGLKYFVLGALMTSVFLLGSSFVYGYTGSIDLYEIGSIMNNQLQHGEANIGLIIGSILMLSTIIFKLSAAPLHVWTPDVYEGSPTASVAYFSTAQKLGLLVVLSGLIYHSFNYSGIYSVIKVIAIISMVFGSLGALMQNSIKRLMAYSSILNIGYALIAVATGNHHIAYTYMLVYVFTVAGFFACMASLLGASSDDASLDDLKGIALERKALAVSVAILIFSFIGLPPFGGFFAKLLVFWAAFKSGEISIAIIGAVTSVIAAFYYLKIVKVMYFESSVNKVRIIPTQFGLMTVAGIVLSFVIFIFPMFIGFVLRYGF